MKLIFKIYLFLPLDNSYIHKILAPEDSKGSNVRPQLLCFLILSPPPPQKYNKWTAFSSAV